MKYALFLLVFWSLFPLVGCESGRNPVDGVVVYDFDFDLDPDVDVDLGGGGSGGSGDLPQLDINYPPTISGEISDIRVGETLSFTPTSFDSNGDNLTFSISEKPDWLTFNTSTGSLSGEAPETALGEN